MGTIESFNGKFRDECLSEHWLRDLAHARELIGIWRQDYNEQRPRSSLDYQTPAEFAVQFRANEKESTTRLLLFESCRLDQRVEFKALPRIRKKVIDVELFIG